MRFVWSFVTSFLYAEIGFVSLLILPIASPYEWNRFFESKFLHIPTRHVNLYFFLIITVLLLLLLNATREICKYSTRSIRQCSSHTHDGDGHINIKIENRLRLFRAQRNFYISAFAIFLLLVIRRFITLMSDQANLLAQNEALGLPANEVYLFASKTLIHWYNKLKCKQIYL